MAKEQKMTNTKENKIKREFKLTTIALKNQNSVFLVTFVMIIFGFISYVNMPKELFPEVSFPWVLVQTAYPGNPPVDIENLITRPIEKEIESIKGIKKINSTSAQDASMIIIEFNFGVDISDVLQDVKDAVDKARNELPNDLPYDPLVMDIDPSEFPIMNLNLSGDFSIDQLKEYAERLEDEIETIGEISKVEIVGIAEKEIKINIDQHKLEAFNMSFHDVENAIASENLSISGGEIKIDGTIRSVRTVGEFKSTDEILNIIVKSEKGNIVYLRDVADVIEGYEDAKSFARLNRQPVVSLQVIKKSGENLLSATKKIDEILIKAKQSNLIPQNLNLTITNDQSDMIEKQLNNLVNSMVISVVFVVMVLFFFLGTRNALFVGLAIPLTMLMSIVILNLIGYRINMMVLFGLILALGMLVDNAIVVVENIYRFVDNGHPKLEAAKLAVGEIAVPIITSTATTLAAFIPLAFWDQLMGEFMKYLPITLIIVLSSSLFVALVIIPVFSYSFIKTGQGNIETVNKKRAIIIMAAFAGIALIGYIMKAYFMANLLMCGAVLTIFNITFLNKSGNWFKNKFLVILENSYLKLLKFTLKGKKPLLFILGTILLLVFSIILLYVRQPKIEFFPSSDPTFINIMAKMPIGTDINATNEKMKEIENYVIHLLKPFEKDSVVKSVLTNIGTGANLENDLTAIGQALKPDKGLITVSFVDYEFRNNVNTSEIMKMLSDSLLGRYPGILLTIEKNRMGPPTGKPINIEVSGFEYSEILNQTDSLSRIIEHANIDGIEGLRIDMDLGKPEMIVTINRENARRFGLSTGQIATTIRTALFGKEISDFKIGEDEYPIQLRLKEKYRNDVTSLMNQKIVFRTKMGKLRKIPISAVANFDNGTTYGSVRRKDTKRVVTLYSNVIEGYNANEINKEIKETLKNYHMPKGYEYKFTGEQQDQAESEAFLAKAMLIAISLIILILVSQFNSIIKPGIIIASVLFSTIGVFGGIATFNMPFVVIMTGIGIVSLAGVVVNNAIVLIDYIDLLKARKREELGLKPKTPLPADVETDCVVTAGKTRLRPVLLTAITTILALFPMAFEININFSSLLNNFDPEFYVGGDMAAIWAPISWTVIFGLTFATFLTLVVVPAMYVIASRVKLSILKMTGKIKNAELI